MAGILLGTAGGAERLHWLLEAPFDGATGELRPTFVAVSWPGRHADSAYRCSTLTKSAVAELAKVFAAWSLHAWPCYCCCLASRSSAGLAEHILMGDQPSLRAAA